MHQELVVAHIGDREVEHNSSGSDGGRNEELEGSEHEQEENSGGVVVADSPMKEMVGETEETQGTAIE